MSKVYLSLGSNLGDRLGHLKRAVQALGRIEASRLTALSSVYETEPVGYEDQPRFLNLVAALETQLEPMRFFERCRQIEDDLGRVRTVRWGPRTIDIDVLLFGDLEQEDSVLTLPHPRMAERAFVLVPLLEIDPDAAVSGTPARACLDALAGEEGQEVRFFASTDGWKAEA